MEKLNLPQAELRVRRVEDAMQVYDVVRRRYVALTPEEWVRQHFLHFLIYVKGYPGGRMAVEKSLSLNGKTRRADIVFYSSEMKPDIIVECKASSVAITQEVMDQAVEYHMSLGGRIICLTNGLKTVYAVIDRESERFYYMRDLPDYESFER